METPYLIGVLIVIVAIIVVLIVRSVISIKSINYDDIVFTDEIDDAESVYNEHLRNQE